MPGPPGWGVGRRLTIQPCKKLLLRNPKRGGQGPIWYVEPYDDDDDEFYKILILISNVYFNSKFQDSFLAR
jgi:hypothetical protein